MCLAEQAKHLVGLLTQVHHFLLLLRKLKVAFTAALCFWSAKRRRQLLAPAPQRLWWVWRIEPAAFRFSCPDEWRNRANAMHPIFPPVHGAGSHRSRWRSAPLSG